MDFYMNKDLEYNSAWIAWERHTRSRSLTAKLKIPLHEIVVKGGPFKRYFLSILKTIKVVNNKNIDILFFQNPSLVLALFLIAVNPFFRKKLIMDAHNAALWPFEGRVRFFNYLASFVIRSVDFSIVTNESLQNYITNLGAAALVLPDPIPDFSNSIIQKQKQKNYKNEVVYICTWSNDEPYYEVIEAARLIKTPSTVIRITGTPPQRIEKAKLPRNVVLEGFVPENDYVNLIRDADVLLDLTERPNCLVCGAYEAAEVGTPCILSEISNSQRIFYKGFIFTENRRSSIADSIDQALSSKKSLEEEIVFFKSEYSKKYEVIISDVLNVI